MSSSAPQNRPRPDSQTIQRMLDENAQLIQAIAENQNKGKAMGCLQYQQILHRNLMYLAGLVDPNLQSVLQPPASYPQMGGQQQSQTHMTPSRPPNPNTSQFSGWNSSHMGSQYDASKSSYNQFSQNFQAQSSNAMQHQALEAEKRRQLLRIRQEQMIQAQSQHNRSITEGQLRMLQSAQSMPSQPPPPPYTTHPSISTTTVNETSQNNG